MGWSLMLVVARLVSHRRRYWRESNAKIHPIAFVRFGMLSHVGTLPGSGLGEGTSWKFFIHLVGSREAMMISVADIWIMMGGDWLNWLAQLMRWRIRFLHSPPEFSFMYYLVGFRWVRLADKATDLVVPYNWLIKTGTNCFHSSGHKCNYWIALMNYKNLFLL